MHCMCVYAFNVYVFHMTLCMHMRGKKKVKKKTCVYAFHVCVCLECVCLSYDVWERPKKKIFQAAIVKRTFPGEKKLVPPMCMRIMCERRKGREKDLPIAIFEGIFGKFETASVHVECVAVCCSVLQCVAVCCTFQLPSSREYFENLRIPVSMLRLIRTLSPGNSFGTYLCGSVCCSACCGVCCNACCRVCCRACWGLHAVCHLDMASAPTRVAVCVAVRVAVCVAVCVAACVAERVGVYMQSVTWK